MKLLQEGGEIIGENKDRDDGYRSVNEYRLILINTKWYIFLLLPPNLKLWTHSIQLDTLWVSIRFIKVMIGLITTLFVSIYHLLSNFFLNSTSWNEFRTRWFLPLSFTTRIIINTIDDSLVQLRVFDLRENKTVGAMLFLFFSSFLISHFSTGARSIPRHFHTPPLKALNLDKKKKKRRKELRSTLRSPVTNLL